MNIVLKRHMGYYVLQVYVPCIMLTILSWVSFFINREATSDRSCIGMILRVLKRIGKKFKNLPLNPPITMISSYEICIIPAPYLADIWVIISLLLKSTFSQLFALKLLISNLSLSIEFEYFLLLIFFNKILFCGLWFNSANV